MRARRHGSGVSGAKRLNETRWIWATFGASVTTRRRITTGPVADFESDFVSLVTVLADQAGAARWSTTGCMNCGSSRWNS